MKTYIIGLEREVTLKETSTIHVEAFTSNEARRRGQARIEDRQHNDKLKWHTNGTHVGTVCINAVEDRA